MPDPIGLRLRATAQPRPVLGAAPAPHRPRARPDAVGQRSYAGVGRTGVMSACDRIAVDGWSVAEAHPYGMNVAGQYEAVKTFATRLQPGEVPGFGP